jgi:hypothetical protein
MVHVTVHSRAVTCYLLPKKHGSTDSGSADGPPDWGTVKVNA